MTEPREVTFTAAMPGWDVLYYRRDGAFDSAPVIAWGIVVDENGLARAVPVTSDVPWSLEDTRTIWTPNGDVTCGDLEHWSSIEEWLDDMRERNVADAIRRPTVIAHESAPVLALDNFRHKFTPHDDNGV